MAARSTAATTLLDDLHRAREPYERRDWVQAYRVLSDQDESDLSGDDFTALATTAFLLGRRNDTVQALQRAYRGGTARGEKMHLQARGSRHDRMAADQPTHSAADPGET